mgnify:CR=1 FL=1
MHLHSHPDGKYDLIDAHSVSELSIKQPLQPVINDLDLSMKDLYRVP